MLYGHDLLHVSTDVGNVYKILCSYYKRFPWQLCTTVFTFPYPVEKGDMFLLSSISDDMWCQRHIIHLNKISLRRQMRG
jgi:hypothetical protein